MKRIYLDADYLAIYQQRKKTLTAFWAVTSAYAVFCLFWVIYHMTLPYADPLDLLPRVAVSAASVIYVLFAFPYLTIKYRRVNRYYQMFCHFGEAMKMEETYHFYGFRKDVTQKNHVDAIGCVFAFWDKRTHEWMEREVYCDPEKELPPFERGDLVHYITQSNFLLEYEIVEKHATELEDLFPYAEEDEDEEESTED